MPNPTIEQLRVDRRSLDIYGVPPLPSITPEEAKRAPELAAFVGRLSTSWDHLGATLKDRFLALTDFKDSTAALALTATQLEALRGALSGHAGSNTASFNAVNGQITIINQTIQNIQNQITHINNLITHIFQNLDGSQLFLFPTDASSWTAVHGFGRRVEVELFDESWDRFEAFVEQPDSATVIARLVPAGRGAMIVS